MRLALRKRLIRGTTAVAIAVGLATGMASTADAARVFAAAPGSAPNANISVKTERWNPGSEIRLHGTGWGANEVVELRFAPTYSSVRANGSGDWYKTITVPWVAPGTYPLQGVGTRSKAVTDFAFPIQPFNPWAEPSTYYSPAGTNVTFTAHRFANRELVDVIRDGKVISTARANKLGEFRRLGGYILPQADAGNDVFFTFKGRRSGATVVTHTSVAPGNGVSGGTTTTTAPATTSTTSAPSTTSTTVPATTTSTTLPTTTVPPTTGLPATTTSTTTAPTTTSTTTAPTTTTSTTTAPTTVPPTTTSTTAPPVVTTPPTTQPPVDEPPAPVTLGEQALVDQLPGQSLWQSVNWVGSTTNDACDFRVTVNPTTAFTVVYPSNRGYTAPPESDTIKQSEATYTAIRLRPDNSVSTPTAITLTATYLPCERGAIIGDRVTQEETITVPVTPPNTDFVQNTTEVGPFPVGSTSVVEIGYTAYAPDIDDFVVRITDASGGTIYYPEEGTFTKPFKQDGIAQLDTDYVGFRINLAGLAPGLKILKVQVTYGPDGQTKDSTLALTIA